MTVLILFAVLTVLSGASSQHQNYVDYDYQSQALGKPAQGGFSRAVAAKPTPVPIIKQINRHNDDGSYTYGYEGADGSFKIETKLPTGEVSGKYGYVDDTGKLRVVDYGANRYGFQPVGDGITVAPPTLIDETTDKARENEFTEYDEEGVLFARPHVQTVARPIVRQPKRSRPAAVRPVQFIPQPQPQPHPQPQPQPQLQPQTQQQFFSYEAMPRNAVPLPSPVPVHHLQSIQQTPAQFPQHVSAQIQQQQQFAPRYFAFEQPNHVPSVPKVIPSPSPAPDVAAPRNLVHAGAPSGPLFRPHALPAPVAPSLKPAPVREHQSRASGSSGSVLDSLLPQYALPQGVGQPLHDISFGSYSSQTNY